MTFYTQIVVLVVILFALHSLARSPKIPIKRYFQLYLLLSLIIHMTSLACVGLIDQVVIRVRITQVFNVSYAIVELLILSLYFRHFFHSSLFTKISNLNSLIISASGFLFIILSIKGDFPYYKEYEDLICSLDLIILAGYCLAYYYHIFKSKEIIDLKHTASFWITTGLFFYCLFSIPFFLISYQISALDKFTYTTLFGVHYIFFSIFLISISRAFYEIQIS